MSENGDVAAATRKKVVGAAEAALILGVERSRISRWKKHGKMPTPYEELAATPVWRTEDIVGFKRTRDRERAARAA